MANRKKKVNPYRVSTDSTSTMRLGDTTMICPICGRYIRLGRVSLDLKVEFDDNPMAGYPHNLVGRTINPEAVLRETSLFYRQYSPSIYDYLGGHLIDIWCADSEAGEPHTRVPMIGVPSVLLYFIDELLRNQMWIVGTEVVESDTIFARVCFMHNLREDTRQRISEIFDDDGNPIFGRVSWSDSRIINILNSSVAGLFNSFYQNQHGLVSAVVRLIDVLKSDTEFMEANAQYRTWFDALMYDMLPFTPAVLSDQLKVDISVEGRDDDSPQ